MRIERLTEEEGPRIRSIRLRSLRESPQAFGSDYEETAARPPESWRQQLRDLATFVAVIEEDDVGVVRGARSTEVDGAAVLLSMWVSPEARGHGVGEALVDAVARWARAEGLTRLLLGVHDDNAAAIALYQRKGFEPTGKAKAGEHERALDL